MSHRDKDDGGQCEHATQECEDEELDRGGSTHWTAPNADQEEHGDERELVAHIEENNVAAHEGQQHAGLQNHEPRVVLAHARGNGTETSSDGKRG